jgi:hypothetical protein
MRIKYFLITAILSVALCVGIGVSAQTTDTQTLIVQLQQQIAQLMAQIKVLQGQQGTTQAWCHIFNANLGFANSGSDEVGALHTILQKENISYGSDDGNTYAEDTAHAVIQLQAKYGILQTGYLGPKTRAKLNALYACASGTQPSAVAQNSVQPTTSTQQQSNTTANTAQTSNVASVKVTSPKAADQFQVGKTYSITWQSNALTNVGIVLINSQTGSRFPIIDSTPASTGFYSWTIPSNIMPNNYYILVGYADALGYSEGFSIVAQPINPNPSGSVTCTDSDNGDYTDTKGTVTLRDSAGNQKTYTDYCQNLNSVQEYSCNYTTTNVTLDNGYKVGNFPCTAGCENGACKSLSSLPAPTITITSPNGGESWNPGEAHDITWTSTNATYVIITVVGNGTLASVANSREVARGISASVGKYSWTIPSDITSLPGKEKSKIYIIALSAGTATANDWSDNYFSIGGSATLSCTDSDGGIDYFTRGVVTDNSTTTGSMGVDWCTPASGQLREWYCKDNKASVVDYTCPNGCVPDSYGNNMGACQATAISAKSIIITSPNGGENWNVGETHDITWSQMGFGLDTNKVNLYAYGFSSEPGYGTDVSRADKETIAQGVSIKNGKYTWTIPSTLSSFVNKNRVKIYALAYDSNGPGGASDYSDNFLSIGSSVGYNNQSQLASISDAIKEILQQLQSLVSR